MNRTAKMFSSSIVSPRLQASLESQAISEGLLSRADYVYGKLYDYPSAYGRRGTDSRILMYLCLFPSINVTRSDFLLGSLPGKTGLSIATIEPRNVREITMCGGRGAMSRADFTMLMEASHKDALQICSAQGRQIIELVESSIVTSNDPFLGYSDDEQNDIRLLCRRSFLPTIELLTGWYGGDMSATPFQGLGFELQLADGGHLPKLVADHPYFEMWLDKVDDLYVRLLASLFFSKLEEKSFSADRWWPSATVRRLDASAALDVTHMVTIKFRDELRLVPDPRCISEAIEMGHSLEMCRLREKISEWIDCIGSGELQLEHRIRSDISKASRELRRLKRYKEFSDSPIFMGTKLVLGQVPVLSNAVSIIEGGMWAYERWAAKRNCWIAIK